MDAIFEDAEAARIKIFFSVWNVGEVLGIFDRYKRRKLINEDEFKEAVGKFTNEFMKLAKLRYLDVVPLHTNIITKAIKIILEYHVYEADAIQIISSKKSNCEIFLTGDWKLVEVGRSIGITAFDVEKEGKKIRDFVESCN